jgi:hypothetical protein
MVDLALNLDVEVGFVVVLHDFPAMDGVDDILWVDFGSVWSLCMVLQLEGRVSS